MMAQLAVGWAVREVQELVLVVGLLVLVAALGLALTRRELLTRLSLRCRHRSLH